MDNAIEVSALQKRFGRHMALRGVDLNVSRGSVTALLGVNGAGKTTLLRCLMGMITPDGGEARVLGYPLGSGFPPVELKARVGYVGERLSLYDPMTAAELIAFVRQVHRRWDQATVARYLELFGLPLGQRIRTYSTGMRSQLALTLAMGGSPDLLLLDEPTMGLDPYHRNQYLQVLLTDAVEAGRTILLSTHDLHQIERLADHVILLREGRVAMTAPLDELKEEMKRVRVAFAGEVGEGELAALPGVLRVRREGRSYLLTVQGTAAQVAGALQARGDVAGLQAYDLSLEEIFLALAVPER